MRALAWLFYALALSVWADSIIALPPSNATQNLAGPTPSAPLNTPQSPIDSKPSTDSKTLTPHPQNLNAPSRLDSNPSAQGAQKPTQKPAQNPTSGTTQGGDSKDSKPALQSSDPDFAPAQSTRPHALESSSYPAYSKASQSLNVRAQDSAPPAESPSRANATTQSRQDSKPALESRAESPRYAFAHPLLQGLRALSSLQGDNFINLDSKDAQGNGAKGEDSTKEDFRGDTLKNSTQHAESKRESKPDSKDSKQESSLDSKPQTPPASKDSKDSKLPQSPTQKPKVLLIMDDIAKLEQLKELLALPLHITPSIFPTTKQTPNAKAIGALARKNHRSFMVHLPLEARHYPQPLLSPLPEGASRETILRRLTEIKRDFPTLTYLNNHTGSAFTQNLSDMTNLLAVFDELGFKFIDSITTPKPASAGIARREGRLIMARDVFLDNEQKVAYTKKQLASLIRKARKKGYAIAICHPHPSTFEALRQMSNELNASLELLSPQDLESYLIKQGGQYVRAGFFE